MTNWLKEIVDPSTTTASVFAGDALNYVIQYFKEINHASGDPTMVAKIGTETRFLSGKLRLWDSDKSHTVNFATPNYVEDKTLNLPATLAQSDTIMTTDAVQAIVGKTFDFNANTISNLPTAAFNTGGVIEFNGTGSQTVFNIPHSLSSAPTIYFVTKKSTDSLGEFAVTSDATNLIVTYATPPPSGTANVDLVWAAGAPSPSPMPYLAAYDYYVYIDTFDASKVKARNKAGSIEFINATDAGAVINACITALPTTGGLIILGSGSFPVVTTINPKNYIAIRGSGINKTILKLANSANKDVMANATFDAMTAARPATGYFLEAGVLHDITLAEFSIDGNKANNPTGRYGIAKIAYGWELTNIMVYNCKLDGIYSEWGTTAGCPGTPDPTMRCMEDYWVNVYMHHCDGQGLRFRGPHDTYMVNIMCWGHFGKAATWESSGTLYSGGAQVHQYHCFATTNPSGQIMTEITAYVMGTNWAIEGGNGTGGIGLQITDSSRVQLTGSRIFNNETGIKIVGGTGYACLEGNEYDGNVYGIKLFGVQNKVSGYFHDNTNTDIVLGDPTVSASYNDIRAKCTRTPLALNWAVSTNANNYVDLSVVLLSGHVAISGTPRMEDNYVSVWAIDSSNNRIPANAGRFMPVPSHLPSYKKWGVFFAGSATAGEGLFHGLFTASGTATHPTPSDADGKLIRYTSAATINTFAGIRLPYPITKQAWRPTMRVKFKIENTDCRVFLGWKGTSGANPTGDDVLNAEPGFYFGKQAGATSWQVLHNEGTGTTVVDNVAGNPAPNTSTHIVDFWADNTGWGLRLDGGADNHFTSEIPTTAHYMALAFGIETASAAARYIDIMYVELVQDK